jgi:hypothetical protein
MANEFTVYLERDGMPLVSAEAYILPQNKTYPQQALRLYPTIRTGFYFRGDLPNGEYQIVLLEGRSILSYAQNIQIAPGVESRILVREHVDFQDKTIISTDLKERGKFFKSDALTGKPTFKFIEMKDLPLDPEDLHKRLHPMDSEEDHPPADELNFGDIVRANPNHGKIEFFTLITPGTKETGTDGGEYKQICYDSNWLYFCIVPGEPGTAIWKKFPLLTT